MKNILIAMLVLGIIGCDQSPEQKEKIKSRDAIKLCWKDYEKKSFSASTKQFVASVCEKMENDFKQKYGINP